MAELVTDRDLEVLLYNAATDEEEQAGGRERLAIARNVLYEVGIPTERIRLDVVHTDAPVRDLGDAASEYDLVVMGENAPSIRSYVFGEDHQRVADRSVGPVSVLRREQPHGPEDDLV